MKKEIIEIKQTKITDWYNKLLDDLWELAQTKIIEFKHQIGKRIIQDWDKFGKPEYGNKFVENLAKDLQISSGDLYRCIQFARKYLSLDEVYNSRPGARITWKWIKKELLPEHKQESDIPPIDVSENYSIIYADPPWRYEHPISTSRKIEQNYPTMELTEIKKIKIPSDGNALLFLWSTSPKLTESLEVLDAWGFKYRTNAIWDKEKIGMGYWFRGQHELLLVGVKGDFSPPNAKERVSSVFRIPRTKHSQKPDEIRNLITKWYPKHKKIELFARKKADGWVSWGNEI